MKIKEQTTEVKKTVAIKLLNLFPILFFDDKKNVYTATREEFFSVVMVWNTCLKPEDIVRTIYYRYCLTAVLRVLDFHGVALDKDLGHLQLELLCFSPATYMGFHWTICMKSEFYC